MQQLRRLYSCLLVFAVLQSLAVGLHAQSCEDRKSPGLRLVATDRAGGGDGAISPDGKSFVISSKRSGSWDLWIYHIELRQWTQVTNDPADELEAQWSPDGTQLAYTATKNGNKDIFVLTLRDRKAKELTSSPEDDEYPAWSPDGKTIVYTGGPWKGRDFFLIPADGGPSRKLTRQSGKAGACSYSPDGQSVVCHKYDDGTGDIIRIPLNGDDPVTLTSGGAWDYKPTVSPDGRFIAFSRSNESPSAIWLMPLDGRSPRPLVRTVNNDRWPTWSASGKQLFFHRVTEVGTAVKILDRATGKVKTVVGADEKPMQASFDPQARRIVYCAEENGRRVLRILNLSDLTARTLDTGGGEADFPRWSPDGSKIAFVSNNGERWEVCTINVDGTNLTALTQPAKSLKGMNGVLDWSPDNSKIVFKADTDPFEANLFIIDTRSGNVRNVTNDKWFSESPSWTPDGQRIIFMSTRGGDWTWGLFSLSLADGGIKVISSPDYTEKNFPRTGGRGWAVWSAYGEDGAEYIAEKSPSGKIRILKNAGPGSRWPSYSADGHLLLYTTIERHVEYWLAEDPFAVGAPAAAEAEATKVSSFVNERVGSPAHGASAGPTSIHRSPVNLFHR